MTGRFVLKIGDCLEDAEKKKYYNERVFSEIAPRYVFITEYFLSDATRHGGARWFHYFPLTNPPFALISPAAPATSRFCFRQVPAWPHCRTGHHRADAPRVKTLA